MKKLAATILTLLISGSAFALPLGNPWEASLMCEGVFCAGEYPHYRDPCIGWCDAWSFRIGFYGDYVFNRRMELANSADSSSATEGSSVRDTEIYTNAAYLALNFWDRLDLFATLGGTRIEISSFTSSFLATNNIADFISETETAFSWSLGLRASLWECHCFQLGAEAQYFRSSPDVNFVRVVGEETFYQDDISVSYREWQIGLGISYRINIICCSTALLPYAGIKWGKAQINTDNFEFIPNLPVSSLESEHATGYAIGVTLLGCNKGTVTVEGRFANEKAVHVNAQIRY